TTPEVGAGQRRLSAVRSETPALGDDAIELVTPARPDEDSTPDFIRNLNPGANEPAASSASTPSEQVAAELETARQSASPEPAREPAEAESEAQTETPKAPEPAEVPRRTSKKRGRASVPSWDEI